MHEYVYELKEVPDKLPIQKGFLSLKSQSQSMSVFDSTLTRFPWKLGEITIRVDDKAELRRNVISAVV